jgi:hypothetical protein
MKLQWLKSKFAFEREPHSVSGGSDRWLVR